MAKHPILDANWGAVVLFGCNVASYMGSDQQDQWLLQFYVNRIVFGMTLQQPIEVPKFSREHFTAQTHPDVLNRGSIEPIVGASGR